MIIRKLNSSSEPLTFEMLRTFEGLEHLTEEEATDTLLTLQQFAALLYEYYLEVKTSENELQEPLN